MNINWMPTTESYTIALLATAVTGILLTQPVELRERRFLRILLSLAAVWFGISGAGQFQAVHTADFIGIMDKEAYLKGTFRVIVASTVLALLWASVLTHYGARFLFGMLDSSSEAQAVDLRPIHEIARTGNNGKALRALQKVSDESTDAKMLEIQLLRNSQRPAKAKRLCKRMLRRREGSCIALEALLAQMS